MPMRNRDLEERINKEIEFCQVYATQFNHGTDVHLKNITIATLTGRLNNMAQEITLLRQENTRLKEQLSIHHEGHAASGHETAHPQLLDPRKQTRSLGEDRQE